MKKKQQRKLKIVQQATEPKKREMIAGTPTG